MENCSSEIKLFEFAVNKNENVSVFESVQNILNSNNSKFQHISLGKNYTGKNVSNILIWGKSSNEYRIILLKYVNSKYTAQNFGSGSSQKNYCSVTFDKDSKLNKIYSGRLDNVFYREVEDVILDQDDNILVIYKENIDTFRKRSYLIYSSDESTSRISLKNNRYANLPPDCPGFLEHGLNNPIVNTKGSSYDNNNVIFASINNTSGGEESIISINLDGGKTQDINNTQFKSPRRSLFWGPDKFFSYIRPSVFY